MIIFSVTGNETSHNVVWTTVKKVPLLSEHM